MALSSHSWRQALPAAAMLALGIGAAQAQTPERRTAFGAGVNTLQYQGNLGSDFWQLFAPQQVGVNGHISRYLSPSFDVSLQGNYISYRFVGDPIDRQFSPEFTSKTYMFDLGLKLKLNNGKILKENAFIQPYLVAGGGLFVSNSSRNYLGGSTAIQSIVTNQRGDFQNELWQPQIFGLAGLRFRLSPSFALDITTSQHYAFTDNFDNLVNPSGGTWRGDRTLVHTVGLTYAVGKPKDTDGDGVPDRKDKCPDTPAGVKVDLNGCPLDTDGDGVPDYQDKCPDQKGTAALQGCPDSDNDGVADGDDKCPNTPTGVKVDATGCPIDSDGDGVGDYLDKCPNTPSGVKVDANGCPVDSDGDGVPDYQDKCPNQAGPASNQGCPEIKAEDKKILQEATKYINFEFDKARLLPSSFPRLNEMVRILNEYPDYSLSIAGHTDSKGNDLYNLRLSYERALAARAYLLSKGIPASRIEARGYGKAKPVADNKTAAGQALNRRVDFDPYLTGTPNAAEVKYGPAQPEPTEAEVRAAGAKATPAKGRKAPARRAPARRR